MPIINQMRRRLVETGDLDDSLQKHLEGIATTGDSFGEARRRRGRSARDLARPPKDIRQDPAEYLWFVGDYASFDPRAKQASAALARVLELAGIDVGLLQEAERTAGCDVRRVGEEGLWTSIAEENVRAIEACRFERIVTTDPHTYHTLRNEYPQVGGTWSVIHHSKLWRSWLRRADCDRWRPGSMAPSPTTTRATWDDTMGCTGRRGR